MLKRALRSSDGHRSLIVSIAGTTSSACVLRIETALHAQEAVLPADVSLAAKQATVSYDPYLFAPRRPTEEMERLGYETPRWRAFSIRGEYSGA